MNNHFLYINSCGKDILIYRYNAYLFRFLHCLVYPVPMQHKIPYSILYSIFYYYLLYMYVNHNVRHIYKKERESEREREKERDSEREREIHICHSMDFKMLME